MLSAISEGSASLPAGIEAILCLNCRVVNAWFYLQETSLGWLTCARLALVFKGVLMNLERHI
jgi:hypothetical protein